MDSDLLHRARVHLAAGRPENAGAIAEIYCQEVEPHDAQAHLILSKAAYASGRLAKGIREADRAVTLAPSNPIYRQNFVSGLDRVAAHAPPAPQLAEGAHRLLGRLRGSGRERERDFSTTRSIDLVLPMVQPAGAELNAIETAARLRPHVPTRIWSDVSPHPLLLELDPTIQTIGYDNVPSGDTLAVMGLYREAGTWIGRVAPRRVILRYNVAYVLQLLDWLGATARLPAERIDVLFASQALKDAVGIDGDVLPSITDTGSLKPREPVQSVSRVGRMSRDKLDKHHPKDPSLYRSLLDMGVAITIMGGSEVAAFLPEHDRLTVMPAYAVPAPVFLHGLDLFLYRTGTFFEAWGRVIVEAMGSGLPVVCHRSGGYAEVIRHGENGFLFDSNDEAAEIVARVRNDTATLRRIGEAARETATALASPRMVDRIVDYYLRG
jgi:glycosyltransferase involved in cell wall biosynthesis